MKDRVREMALPPERLPPIERLCAARLPLLGAEIARPQAVTAALGGLIERGAARTVAEFPEG